MLDNSKRILMLVMLLSPGVRMRERCALILLQRKKGGNTFPPLKHLSFVKLRIQTELPTERRKANGIQTSG